MQMGGLFFKLKKIPFEANIFRRTLQRKLFPDSYKKRPPKFINVSGKKYTILLFIPHEPPLNIFIFK